METQHKKGITRDDVKFFLLIMTIVIGVIIPAVSYRVTIETNAEKITEIRGDSKDSWGEQLTINERLKLQVAELDKGLEVMRTRVDYIEK